MQRISRYGGNLPRPPQSDTTILLVEPSAGFNSSQPMTDLQPGQTPYSRNLLFREGGMELRPTLSQYTGNPKLVDFVTGGMAVVSSVGSNLPLISGTTQFAYYSTGSWSLLSYISTAGGDAPPSGNTKQYYDMVQSYYPTADEMVALAACESYQTIFAWQAGAAVFSSVTSAPRARYLATVDNFVLAANVKDSSSQSKYIQRVQWSDRGDPLVWLAASDNLAGFEDLLAAQGGITRLMVQDERVIIFFEREIWQGVRTTGATSFQFSPLDKTVGCPYGRTVAQTPLGLMFLGRDLMVYLLPKGGGVATPIGYPVRRHLQNRIDSPQNAWATFDQPTNTFRLYYPTIAGTGLPTEAVWLNLGENAWAPQNFAFNLTHGFQSQDDNVYSGVTWGGITGTWGSMTSTWEQLAGSGSAGRAASAIGTSDGTMYFDSMNTMDDTVPVRGIWRSQGLGADTPGRVKNLRTIRMDYQSNGLSGVTIAASPDQGVTFYTGQRVSAPQTATEACVDAYPYCTALYPSFQLEMDDSGLRVFRFWIEQREGGRP